MPQPLNEVHSVSASQTEYSAVLGFDDRMQDLNRINAASGNDTEQLPVRDFQERVMWNHQF